MKVQHRNTDREFEISYDPKLDNLPVPRVVEKKIERARKFLEEHPIPENLLKRK